LIEGHADERGSREYNIALGERRATAVQRFLEAEGVDRAQINTISYGEERPAAFGSDEVSWSENRRAVLVY
jgi:peptidoglycan-associated lipoprotein